MASSGKDHRSRTAENIRRPGHEVGRLPAWVVVKTFHPILPDGWYWSLERGNEEKLHAALVSDDKLSEAYQEKGRNGIRTCKDILALVGFTISNKRA